MTKKRCNTDILGFQKGFIINTAQRCSNCSGQYFAPALQSFGAEEPWSQRLDGESTNGGTPATFQPERLPGESQTASSGQATRGQ